MAVTEFTTPLQQGVTVRIDSGDDESDYINLGSGRARRMLCIEIWSPATLTNSVRVQKSLDAVTWLDVQSAGADIAVPAASVVIVTNVIGVGYLRLLSAAAEADNRDFVVYGVNRAGPVG